MHDTPAQTAKANAAIRNWAARFLLIAAVLLTASLTAIPPSRAEKPWVSPHYRDHALTGTIWTADFKPVTMAQLEASVRAAKFVLLGEIHTNADHHRLQARMIETLVRAGRRPAIVLEMVPASLQAELDRHLESGEKDAGKLGEFLEWEKRGWPDWAIYRPIAEAALAAGLPLLGGALDRDTTRAISKSDPSQAALIMDLKLDRPVRPEIVQALSAQIAGGHCNMLPETAVKPMIMVQLARDAQMAKAMLAAPEKDGAVLIAGSGHIRKDWAVPSFIRQSLPSASIASVAFLEVDPERSSPSDYAETIAGLEEPYDFIYFTPKADLIDRCAEMAKHMESMKRKK